MRDERRLFSGAMLVLWIAVTLLALWVSAPPPQPTGMVLQMLAQSAERAYGLADRGDDMDERCETAHRASELYKRSDELEKIHQWTAIAKAECERREQVYEMYAR